MKEKNKYMPELLAKAFNASPCLMAISSIEEGRYLQINKCFEEVTGYSSAEVLGYSAIEELKIWEKSENRTKAVDLLFNQGSFKNLELNFRIKSGELRVGLFSAEIIELNGEKCILSVANDITELKKLQNEVERLDRLNLVGQIAASIGHEVRNPLTCVRGFLQLFKDKEELSKFKDIFDLMIEELDRANSIITEFLSLSRNKATVLLSKNINKVVETIAPLIISSALETQCNIKFELETVNNLLLDEEEIRQLILNLTKNGLDAMPGGGQLIIKTYQENEDIIMSLEDQGTGISAECIDKIGQPFFTTKDQGTGLGLAVCYSIAERHNAKISIVTSHKGTTFYIRFKSTSSLGRV